MEKIVFTLCSNNYLPQAILLAESFFKHNSGYLFVIGLVDKKSPQISYPGQDNITVVECEEVVSKPTLLAMAAVYKIVELNTSVKPFYFDYIFRTYPDAQKVIYLDPDIYVYNSFEYIEKALDENDILLTPHTCTPYPLDGLKPSERSFLMYGIYNLGFIAVKRSANTINFVNWFKDRLQTYCYAEAKLGMYVDQLWANLIPVLFDKVQVSRHLGLNCAYWNIHERWFSLKDNVHLVNDSFLLLFFHFSAIDINNYEGISRSQNRFDVSTREDLKSLLQDYTLQLKTRKQEQDYNIPCVYTKRTYWQKLQYYKNRYHIRKHWGL
jgi:hypothetical protein